MLDAHIGQSGVARQNMDSFVNMRNSHRFQMNAFNPNMGSVPKDSMINFNPVESLYQTAREKFTGSLAPGEPQ